MNHYQIHVTCIFNKKQKIWSLHDVCEVTLKQLNLLTFWDCYYGYLFIDQWWLIFIDF